MVGKYEGGKVGMFEIFNLTTLCPWCLCGEFKGRCWLIAESSNLFHHSVFFVVNQLEEPRMDTNDRNRGTTNHTD